MPNYDLSSIGAVSASAELAHIRANQEPNQDSYNAAWLHGYADALAIPYVAIIGESELAEKRLTLKNMASGEQMSVAFDDIVSTLTN